MLRWTHPESSDWLLCRAITAAKIPALAAYLCGGATVVLVLGVCTIVAFVGNVRNG